MTLPRPLRPPFQPRAGSAVTALFLGSLAISASFGMVLGPFLAPAAAAQSVPNPNDQPTPATLPERDRTAAERPNGQVAPPKAISATTEIVASDRTKGSRTNPLDHLPARDRAATGGTRRD